MSSETAESTIMTGKVMIRCGGCETIIYSGFSAGRADIGEMTFRSNRSQCPICDHITCWPTENSDACWLEFPAE
jgi:hypothetical protein